MSTEGKNDREHLENELVKHYNKMSRYLNKYHLTHADKEDVLQTAFVAALKNLDALRDETKLEPWLRSIVNHVALNFKKADERRQEKLVEVENLNEVIPS